jgi:hypothetical protein
MEVSALSSATEAPECYWTAVGNIIQERPYGPGGAEIRLGTKHFAPGAKVYIIDWFAGTCARIVVIGLHRKSKKLIRLVIDVKLVENLRPKLCYNPTVIKKIHEHYSPTRIKWLTKEFAETICKTVPYWQAELRKGAGGFKGISTPYKETSASHIDPDFRHQDSFLARLWINLCFLLKG